ncbi:MAG: pyridoxal-dependent decarboxylase [Pirellulales bacterium]
MSDSQRDVSAARARIARAYDPNTLEAAGTRLMAVLADHMRRVQAGDAKSLNWAEPEDLIRAAKQFLKEPPGDIPEGVARLAAESLARGNNLHHPHYVGHQVPASVPLAALFDMIGAATNQVMAIYEMGPWATAVERAMVAAVGERLGFAAGTFAGLVTSGGSLANLTALLTARNVVLGDAWSTGLTGRRPAPVLVTNADSHYCVTRSAGILGLGTQQIVRAALDNRRRMDPGRLDATLADLRSRGVPIVAAVAASGATPTGACDRLTDLADVCRRHDVWLHVDAAHGGGLAFSPRHRHLVAGIERCDSVVCDAHKMLFMPALCALVFYRNPAHRIATFHQDAPYLFDPAAPQLAEYDSGIVNLECTKRAAALGLWGIWSLFGPELFADLVDVTVDLAKQFHSLLEAADDFQTLHEPECNIVAFRYVPQELRNAPPEQVDALQSRLRRQVIKSGRFFLTQTRINGRCVLRTTLINPLTTIDDLRALMDCLREFGGAH